MKAKVLLVLIAIMLALNTQAQKVKIDVGLLKDNVTASENFVIKIIDEDFNTTEIRSIKRFTATLDYDKEYKIIFYCDGCQPKYIYFDTNTSNKRKLKYVFNVSLQTTEKQDLVNAGGVYYDTKRQEFSYYLN